MFKFFLIFFFWAFFENTYLLDNERRSAALPGFNAAKKALVWRILVAYTGVKEPEVGIFEAVFLPFSFAFAAFNFALNKIGGGGAPFSAGMRKNTPVYAGIGWRFFARLKGTS